MVQNDADVGIMVLGFAGAGRPVLLGVTGRLEFVDAPSRVEDLERYRARGDAMWGTRTQIVTGRPQSIADNVSSVNAVNPAMVRWNPPRPAIG